MGQNITNSHIPSTIIFHFTLFFKLQKIDQPARKLTLTVMAVEQDDCYTSMITETGEEYRVEIAMLQSIFQSSELEEILNSLPKKLQVVEKDGLILGLQEDSQEGVEEDGQGKGLQKEETN